MGKDALAGDTHQAIHHFCGTEDIFLSGFHFVKITERTRVGFCLLSDHQQTKTLKQ